MAGTSAATTGIPEANVGRCHRGSNGMSWFFFSFMDFWFLSNSFYRPISAIAGGGTGE